MQVISIIIGGILGALLRYFVSLDVAKTVSGHFPWPTLTVNLIGSFFIGLLWGFFENSNASVYVKSFVFVGFVGSFTTFSTFSLDIFNLIRRNDFSAATLYWLISTTLGVLFAGIGYVIAKKILTYFIHKI